MHKNHVTFVELEAAQRSILKQSNVEFLRYKIWYILRIMVIWVSCLKVGLNTQRNFESLSHYCNITKKKKRALLETHKIKPEADSKQRLRINPKQYVFRNRCIEIMIFSN